MVSTLFFFPGNAERSDLIQIITLHAASLMDKIFRNKKTNKLKIDTHP
jgi:hypothetical protein